MKRILLFFLMCASSSVANAMAVPGVARGEDVEDKPVAAMNKEVANQLLMDGARDGNLNLVQTALAKGADVNHVRSITVPRGTIENITPLIAASLHNNHEVVRLLIERGADVNKKAGPSVATPLMEAVGMDAREIAELLLDAGAELEARDGDGNTALWYAIFDRHPEMVQLLINRGASIWAENDLGGTPYARAELFGRPTERAGQQEELHQEAMDDFAIQLKRNGRAIWRIMQAEEQRQREQSKVKGIAI